MATRSRPAPAGARQRGIRIADTVVRPGQRGTASLRVASLYTSAPVDLPVIVLPSPSLTPRRLLSRSAAGSVARPAVVLRLGALSLANRFSGGASRCAWQMRRQMRLADAPGFDEPADARWA